MKVSLKVIQEKPAAAYSCAANPHRCDDCQMNVANGGRCNTCSPAKLASCDQKESAIECGTCGGYNAEVPAICCRSPLGIVSLTQAAPGGNFQQPEYVFSPRKVIELKSRSIVVTNHGWVNITKDSPYLDEMDSVAVSIGTVWSKKGFYSADLKDYLRISKSQKLILITDNKDDLLEDMWDTDTFGGEEYKNVGIDYWAPVTFSVYHNDGNMNRYWQMLRTLTALSRGKAHFVPIPSRSDHEALVVDDLFIEATKKVKQCIFNAQFLNTEDAFRRSLSKIAKWHRLLPIDIPFWFVGAAKPKFCHNVKKITGERKRYYVSANAFTLAGYGKRLYVDGKEKKYPTSSKEDLLMNNQRAFKEIVEKWG